MDCACIPERSQLVIRGYGLGLVVRTLRQRTKEEIPDDTNVFAPM